MLSEKPLSDLYQMYINGDLLRKNLEGGIFKHLLENYERYHVFGGKRERWDDFLSWLYPRLSRAIDLYRDLGSSFDVYIRSLVFGAAKEYRSKETDHYITEYVCWWAKAEEQMLYESEPEYLESKKGVSIPEDINSRQIMILLLKSYYFVSEELVKRVAETVGIEFEQVLKMIDELKRRRSGREAGISELRERLESLYYRCLSYQKRMSSAQAGSYYHEKMKSRFERAKKRHSSMRKRLRCMRMSASNRMIAEVMGIPHGTVDTSIFAMKNHLASSASLAY
jgi:phage regulator Rha-like protein